ncbi:helix-turn-helix domain-containing protein [Bacteroides fragilis]|uniref:helix-turn-helix domain-containing protein n=1 Tax=Bacteroides fragilis TaxID=817 RepID=UPI001F1AF235|nr:helix-turn-helix domain-containing protein [Bacteroides fragilis]MCZ2604159.1 helix-turn-helix domain-containing protein [Bacteroides fragilis]
MKSLPIKNTSLTLEETNLILKARFTITRLDKIRDIFLFSCFTGLSYNDIKNLTINNLVITGKEDEIERLNYIEEYLLGKLNCLNNIDKQFIYVAEYIRMTNGMVLVNELLDKVCLSQRQFERQFKNLTGMTPKMFSSITRFSLSEKYLRLHPNESLFSVALDCGYYDHSHLIREFKRFGGASPQALMSNLYTISPLFPYYLCTPKKV